MEKWTDPCSLVQKPEKTKGGKKGHRASNDADDGTRENLMLL